MSVLLKNGPFNFVGPVKILKLGGLIPCLSGAEYNKRDYNFYLVFDSGTVRRSLFYYNFLFHIENLQIKVLFIYYMVRFILDFRTYVNL